MYLCSWEVDLDGFREPKGLIGVDVLRASTALQVESSIAAVAGSNADHSDCGCSLKLVGLAK